MKIFIIITISTFIIGIVLTISTKYFNILCFIIIRGYKYLIYQQDILFFINHVISS